MAEDCPPNARLTERLLQQHGWECHTVNNGQAAVEFVEREGLVHFQQEFDVLLMDKHMPAMNGEDATKRLRAMGVTLPIIGVTGCAMDDEQKSFFDAGISDLLLKPFTKDGLLALLSKHQKKLTS